MTLDIAEALFVLNLLSNDKLPEVAVAALVDGIDNRPLRILAGLSSVELQTAREFFTQALELLGRGKLSKEEAARRYTRFVARQILSGELSPYEGARRIWGASTKVDTEFHDVDPFIYAASEYEDRPEDREFFTKEILLEAQRWIAPLQ